MTQPWHLDDGLQFEDACRLIRWGTAFETLRADSATNVLDRETSVHLSWPVDRFFGGINAIASACQILEPANPRAYHIYLPVLAFVSLALVEEHPEPREAHRQLRRLHDHLVVGIGPATFSYPNYAKQLPAIFWEQGPLRISLGPQYGSTALGITIAQDPDGYDELRTQARAIRTHEGEGRRVEHVAWHTPFDDPSAG